MLKRLLCILCIAALGGTLLFGCSPKKEDVKIGVSLGVGQAPRWAKEKVVMEEYAQELGVTMETRLNTTDEPKTQKEDCFELIDSGVDVLIYTPRDINDTSEILAYAKEKDVKVVDYARAILKEQPDIFVGYDSSRIGQSMGQYLSEMVIKGDYIILKGDPGDYNAMLLYEGAMRYIDPIRGDINVILEEAVPGWSAEEAKKMVVDAVAKNNNRVDAILAPNDKLAGACAEALAELGVSTPVVITGMDADLAAAKRIVAGTQSMTVYMNLEDLARTAVDQAYKMAMGEEPDVNAEFDNQGSKTIPSNLINGQVITQQNIDKMLIDSGYYTREEIYGTQQ